MKKSDPPAPISDLLRQTVLQAVQAGRTNYKSLERETGITRASIMRFVRGSQFLRLDMADRLAAYFGLELRPAKGRQGTGKGQKKG
jgi:plasmid maintenance system antidote protein VapI